MKDKSSNVVWQQGYITRDQKEELLKHRSALLWFTGLSGAGKSTLAHAVEQRLYKLGHVTMVLDGDNIRHGLCGDLTFNEEDRTENIRRVSEVAKLFVEAGVIVLTAFISPFRKDRIKARELVGDEDFLEIHCHCSLEVCEERDVKGIYKKARAGEIKDFTGISSPYEEPASPALRLNTGEAPLEECVDAVIELLREKRVIPQD